jgi:hypothetical protein
MSDSDHESAWLEYAACKGHTREMTEYQGRPLGTLALEQHERRLIDKYCAHCPVTEQCLTAAYATGKLEDLDWIRGGLRPKDLRARRRNRGSRKAVLPPVPPSEGVPPVSVTEQKAADRVRKLLAQASHHNTSDEESQVFFEKAYRLMEEYGLEEAALRDADPLNDPLVQKKIKLSSSTWRSDITLGAFVARLTDTAMLRQSYVSGYGAFVHFYGRASNVGRAEQLFLSLVAQANVAAARHRHEWHGFGDVRKWTSSVREGYIVALMRRLEALHQERAPSLAPPGVGLVPVSLRDEAKAFADQFKSGPARASNRSVDARGWSVGQRDGQNASLGGAALGGRQALNS